MTIDLSNLPRHVTLEVGGRIEIPLPSYAGSGHTWTAICVCGQGVAQVSLELGEVPAALLLPGDGTVEPPPLMFVPERAVVYGLTCGEATWRLILARSFDPSKPAATHDLLVTVVNSVNSVNS